MTDNEFLDAIKVLKIQYEKLHAEAAPKQARYDELRADMCALVSQAKVEEWERHLDEGRPFGQRTYGPPNWFGNARREMREELFQLVGKYVEDAIAEWLYIETAK